MRLELVVAALIGYLQLSQSIPLEADGEDLEKDNDDCAQYPQHLRAQVLVETLLVYFPIEIKSFFNQNTILNINGGPTININNAPVYINTVVYGSVTSTVTSTLSTIAATNSSVAPSASVVNSKSSVDPVYTASPVTANALTYPAGAIINLLEFYLVPITTSTKKRQVNSDTSNGASTYVSADADANRYIGTDGLLTSCPTAALFNLINGSLFGLSSQLPTTYGRRDPVDNSIFGTSSNLGANTTGFYILNSRLYWINPFFIGEEIIFCILENLLFVVFNGISIPRCLPALLHVLPGPDSACHTSDNTSAPSTATTPTEASTFTTGPVLVSASQSLVTTIPLSSTSFVSGPTSPLPIASTSLPSATTATPSTSGNVISSSIDTLAFSSSNTITQGLSSLHSSPSDSTSLSSTVGILASALTSPSASSSGSIISSLSSTQSEESTLTGSILTSSSLSNGISSTFIDTNAGTYTSSALSVATTDLTLGSTGPSSFSSISSTTTGITTSASSSEEQTTPVTTADTSASTTTSNPPTTTSTTPVCASGQPTDNALVDSSNLNNEEFSMGTLRDCAISCQTITICDYFGWVSDDSGGGLCITFTTNNDLSADLDGNLDSSGSGFFTAACADVVLSSTSVTIPCEFGVTSSGDPVSTQSNQESDGIASSLSDCATQCDQGVILTQNGSPAPPLQCLYFFWDDSTGQCDLYTIDISDQLNLMTPTGGAGYYSNGCIGSPTNP